MIQTIRIQTEGQDLKGESVLSEIRSIVKNKNITQVKTLKIYRLEGLSELQAKKFTEIALSEKITQRYTLNQPLIKDTKNIIEISYKPGVMNPEVGSILKVAKDLNVPLIAADSSFEYAFYGKVTKTDIEKIVQRMNLFNPTIEHIVTSPPKTLQIAGTIHKTTHIPLRTMSDAALMLLSKDKLFLNLSEMQVIQSYFQKIKQDPTDCELEVLAQTWSEHCMHKTFKANLVIDGKKKKSLFERIKQTVKKNDKRVISAFSDNSGVIDFYDGFGICAKVETHNSPSAIEPYGGAMTGSGGVIRDVLGTGRGARVISASDIFCFAPPDLAEKDIPPGCQPPKYILKKVVAGVRDYGNRVGIPTNNGSIHFHKDFRAKPTVAVGAFGVIERKNAQKSTPKIGDLIITIGGQTGRDGIHGATFSSAEMNNTTMSTLGSAVQIGNAIEEKRMLDAVLQLSKEGLIRAITDCGAGGYASAVGEMGEKTGASVSLEKIPLKYTDLSPWEIFLSESQERMVIAINPIYKNRVLEIAKNFNVEAAIIGKFDGSKKLRVFYKKEVICVLDMHFLHDGLPKRNMVGKSKKRTPIHEAITEPTDYLKIIKQILSHGNVCSKEPIVRLYDHNVQGTNALHPFSGVAQDGPNDGAIVKPFLQKPYGLVVTHGLNPTLNNFDSYHGSVWALTEAVSNYVAIGGDLRDAAFIDNFIWPFPDEESLADLDAAVDACIDVAKILKMPFVSGKDSLSSTYRYPDGNILKIPPALLISVFGKIPDVTKTVSSDFKKSDSCIVFIGKQDTKNMGGSTYLDILQKKSSSIPKIDLDFLPKVLTTLTRAIQEGDILSCHDISEGGMLSALSEMCFGGGCGAVINLYSLAQTTKINRPDWLLFNETAGTFLVEVANEKIATKLFKNTPHCILGKTTVKNELSVYQKKKNLFQASLEELKFAWQKPMREIFS